MKRNVLILLVALTLTFACTSDSGTGPTIQLFEIRWKLLAFEFNDGTVVEAPPSGGYSVLFRNDGNLEVRADCNGCGGTYDVKGSGISMELGICTLIACPEGSLDDEFKAALEGSVRYELGGNQLALYFPGGRMIFCDCPE